MSISDVQAIRKHSAQHDVYNRLHSIARDMHFVDQMRLHYEDKIPVVPNRRCGLFYCDPETSSSAYAYFKSTDGHTNQWGFSLRRSNLHLVSYAQERGGFILVDSTRRGKRFPDALSKTVPSWCCVINRAVAARRRECLAAAESSAGPEETGWDENLYLPPQTVSLNEKAQIEARLGGWVNELRASALIIPDLRKPLRPFFIHPGQTVPPYISPDADFVPIICLCASMFVEQGGPMSVRDQWGGYEYIQGSGDDDELWGKGLTWEVFHRHRERLLSCARNSLLDLIAMLLANEPISGGGSAVALLDRPTQVPERSTLYLATMASNLKDVTDIERGLVLTLSASTTVCAEDDSIQGVGASAAFSVTDSKKGHITFSEKVLPKAIQMAEVSRSKDVPFVIRDEDGRNLSVAVAVVILWLSHDENGQRRAAPAPAATKEGIRTRLHWIIQRRPGSNPSRTLLKWVNEFLMSPARPRGPA